jgi:hypothetical protein
MCLDKERQKYNHVYEIIEKYIQNNTSIILAGNKSLQIILKEKQDYTYELFAADALIHANKLANILAESLTYDYVVIMQTIVPRQKFTIKINNRVVAYFTILPNLDTKIYTPKVINNVQIIPPILQLIQTYNALYDIQKAGEWPKIMELEQKILKFTFGAGPPPNRCSPIKLFCENFAKHNDHIILVGEVAFGLIHDGFPCSLDIISDLDPELIRTELRKYYYPVESDDIREKPLLLFSDMRLKKTTIHINGKIIANIYNSASYELIPYFQYDNYNVANKYVLMRFALVETWVVTLLYLNKQIDEQYKDKVVARKKIQYHMFSKLEDKKEKFIGIILDEALYTKLKKKESKAFPEYFPQKMHKITGSYRII